LSARLRKLPDRWVGRDVAVVVRPGVRDYLATIVRRLALLAVLVMAPGCVSARTARHYKLVVFPAASTEVTILSGPPETAGMLSGYVVLRPGEGMHRHSTEANDELLVFLVGSGEVVVGSDHVPVSAGRAMYIPPGTEHEVHASAQGELRYVYTAAPAR
jgi:mannose-6-phosphate isomerase-like protein (cupin superfamily)